MGQYWELWTGAKGVWSKILNGEEQQAHFVTPHHRQSQLLNSTDKHGHNEVTDSDRNVKKAHEFT